MSAHSYDLIRGPRNGWGVGTRWHRFGGWYRRFVVCRRPLYPRDGEPFYEHGWHMGGFWSLDVGRVRFGMERLRPYHFAP